MKLVRVLIRPAEVMREVLAQNRRFVFPLALAHAVSAFLTNRQFHHPLQVIVNILILTGLFYVFAVIVYAAGKFLGGTGSARDVRAGLAWGLVPIILAIVWRLPLALTSPESMFFDLGDSGFQFRDAPAGGCAIALLALAAELIVIGWTIFVATHTVAEAHRFEWTRGLATIAIVAVFPIVVMIAAFLAVFV